MTLMTHNGVGAASGAQGTNGTAGTAAPDITANTQSGGDGTDGASGTAGGSIDYTYQPTASGDQDATAQAGYGGSAGKGGTGADGAGQDGGDTDTPWAKNELITYTSTYDQHGDLISFTSPESDAGNGGNGADAGAAGSASLTATGVSLDASTDPNLALTVLTGAPQTGPDPAGGKGGDGGDGYPSEHESGTTTAYYHDHDQIISVTYNWVEDLGGGHGGNGGNGGNAADYGDGSLSVQQLTYTGAAGSFSAVAQTQSASPDAPANRGGDGGRGGNGSVGGEGGTGGDGGKGDGESTSVTGSAIHAGEVTISAVAGSGGAGGNGGNGGSGTISHDSWAYWTVTYGVSGDGGNGGDGGDATVEVTGDSFYGVVKAATQRTAWDYTSQVLAGHGGSGGQGGTSNDVTAGFPATGPGQDGADGQGGVASFTFDNNVIHAQDVSFTLDIDAASTITGLGAIDIDLVTGALDIGNQTNTLDGTGNFRLDFDATTDAGSVAPDVTMTGTGADNALELHSRGNATLDGGDGNDTLWGGEGASLIYGGQGTDTAAFTSNYADYTLTPASDGTHIVVALKTGGETATLYGVEKLQFADVTVVIGNSGPVSSGAHATLAHGTQDYAYVVTQAQLLTGYSDPDGYALGVTGLTADHGTVTDNHDGTYTLTPTLGFSGTMQLTYSVSDGHGAALATFETVSFDVFSHTLTGSDSVNDGLTGSLGNDTVHGLGGDDTLVGHAGIDFLYGDAGNDSLHDFDGNNSLYGGDGNDTIIGSGHLYGGNNNDWLSDNYALHGAAGDASPTVNSTLEGGLGDDTLEGNGLYASTLSGGGGYDVFEIYRTDDTLMETDNFASGTLYTAVRNYTLPNVNVTSLHAGAIGEVTTDSFVLHGNNRDDAIYGNAGNDSLYGGNGRDVIYGNGGIDYIEGGGGGDNLNGNGTLRGGDQNDGVTGSGWLDGGNGDDYVRSTADNTTLIGGAGNDKLYFHNTTDPLHPTEQADYSGNAGDYAIVHLTTEYGFVVIDNRPGAPDGMDTVYGDGSLHFADGTTVVPSVADTGEYLIDREFIPKSLTGTGFADWIEQSAYDSPVHGGGGSDTLIGDLYAELYGDDGDDVLTGSYSSDTLYGGAGDDTINGLDEDVDDNVNGDYLHDFDGNNVIHGDFGFDTIVGTGHLYGDGDDDLLSDNRSTWLDPGETTQNLATTLDGGTGNDTLQGDDLIATTMIGGAGNDTYYVYRSGDVLTEAANGGYDTVYTTADLTLSANIEKVVAVMTGATHGFAITGNAQDNTIVGGAGDDTLGGGAGTNSIDGGDGVDTVVFTGRRDDYTVTPGAQAGTWTVTLKAGGETTTAVNVEQLQFADVTIGSGVNAAPVLSGTQAALANGSQDHAYVVTQAQLLTGFSDPNGDALRVIDLTADHGTVTDNNDGTFTVTPALGFAGALHLSYTVWDGHGGALAAFETVSFDLFDHTQTGSSAADHLIGSLGGDSLDGGVGSDTLDGSGGNDTLDGGYGDDTLNGGDGFDTAVYIYNRADYDVVYEGDGSITVVTRFGQGSDRLHNVELLKFADGTLNISGSDPHAPELTGALSVLKGTQNQSLTLTTAQLVKGYTDVDGDTLGVTGVSVAHATVTDNHDGTFTVTPDTGFYGIATLGYTVDDGKGGTQTALSRITFEVAHQQTGSSKTMDHLTGTTFDDSLNGAGGDDTLDGGAGNDTLQGGVGNDVMHGGAGNDTYYVDSVNDVISESTGGVDDGGNDRVFSTVSYTLGDFVENINLDGYLSISGIGNSLQNNIYGNDFNNLLSGMNGNDVLKGMAGNDTLSGGKGNDILEGGIGQDTFVFLAASANGTDRILDYEHDYDRLSFNHQDYDSHALFTLGTQAVGSGAQFVWNQATETLWYDHDGAGGDAAIALATFQSGAIVDASDIHFT